MNKKIIKRLQERETENIPVCYYCDKPIKNNFYLINDEILCRDCLEKYFRKELSDYVE